MPIPPLVLDSGAVIGEARRSVRVRALLQAARELGQEILVPAGVVAETVRGGPGDALINRLINSESVHVTIHDLERARTAGKRLGNASTDDAIDALVVAEAVHRNGGVIVTSDPTDIADLARCHTEIRTIRV